MGLLRIHQGFQLLDRQGHLVAGGGELVDSDHPAVREHPDIDGIACVAAQPPPDAPTRAQTQDADLPPVPAPRRAPRKGQYPEP